MIEIEELGEILKEKFEDTASRMRFLEGLKDALEIKARAEKHFGMQLEQAAARIFRLQDHAPSVAKEVISLLTSDMIYSSVAHQRSSDKTLDSVVCNLDRFLEGVNLKRLKKRTKKLMVKNRRNVEKQTKLESEDLRNHFANLESIGDGYQKTLIEALDKATSDAKQLSSHMWRISKTYKRTESLLQQMRSEVNDFASVSVDLEAEPLARDAGLSPKRMSASCKLQSNVTLKESVDGVVVEKESRRILDESASESSTGTQISVASTNVTVAAATASAAAASSADSRDNGIAAVGVVSAANAGKDELNNGDCTEETESVKSEYAMDDLTLQSDIALGSSIHDQTKDDKVAKEATCQCQNDDFDELPADEVDAGSGCEEYFDATSDMDGSGCDWETASALEEPQPNDQTLSAIEASGSGCEEFSTHNQASSVSGTPENDPRACTMIGELMAEDVD